MSMLETRLSDPAVNNSVTDRFVELSDKVNEYLHKFREFGIRSNRAVATYLGVDTAELSRVKNARVGDINLQRAYDILRKCEELVHRLSTFGGPLKAKEVYSVGFSISALPCICPREQAHAIAVQQQSDTVLLTVDMESQQTELDMLLGEAFRSAVNPRRNPYGPFSIMYVLKSVYAAPSATVPQLMMGLRVAHIGVVACEPEKFHSGFEDSVRLRTLAVILNNGGGIALRIAKEVPARRHRMLLLAKYMHAQSLATYYFQGTVRGALTCANDLRDESWARELLNMLVERESLDRTRWSRGINADLDDPQEWQFLRENGYWNLLNGQTVNVAAMTPVGVPVGVKTQRVH